MASLSNKNTCISVLQQKLEDQNLSSEELQCVFYNTAKDIINNYDLIIGDITIKLAELEFYYFNCDSHDDPYVHLSELQKTTSGFLYVHESWGTRGGIDITFGNGKYFGGILIRSIQMNDTYISGPVKVRDKIVEELNLQISSHSKLQEKFSELKEKIYLKKNNNTNNKILHSTRVNLSNKDDDAFKKKFQQALYRFIQADILKSSFETKGNLKETSTIKAISNLTMNCSYNEPSTAKKIKENELLQKYIENFKKNYVKHIVS